MKPQDAPLVTGYALLCAALFVVLTLSGLCDCLCAVVRPAVDHGLAG